MRPLFAALAVLLAGGAARAGEIDTLIDQLGSPDFRARESASKQLGTIGAPALPALQTAALNPDAEVSRRAGALVDAISKRVDNDRTLAPTLVGLSAEDAPLSEVLARLGKQSGYRLGLSVVDPDLSRKAITVKTDGKVPFWAAVERVCDAANLRVAGTPDAQRLARELALRRLTDMEARRAGPGQRRFPTTPFPSAHAPGTLVLWPHAGARNPSCNSGAVRVEAVPVPTVVWATVPANAALVVLEVATEPKLHWVRTDSVRVTKAVDDLGQTLATLAAADPVAPANPTPTRIRRVRGGAIVVVNGGVTLVPGQAAGETFAAPTRAFVRLKAGGRPAKALREFAGVIRGVVRSAPEEIATLTRLGDKPAETNSHGVSLTVGGVTESGDEYAMDVTVNYDPSQVQPANSGAAGMTGTVAVRNGGRMIVRQQRGAVIVNGFNFAQPHGLNVTDADGRVFSLRLTRHSIAVNSGGDIAHQMTLVVRPSESGQGKPAKLSFHGMRTKRVEVPFKLTDVALTANGGR